MVGVRQCGQPVLRLRGHIRATAIFRIFRCLPNDDKKNHRPLANYLEGIRREKRNRGLSKSDSFGQR